MRYLYLLIVMLFAKVALSQGLTDTVFSLQGVDIIGRRPVLIAKGQEFIELDSSQLARSNQVTLAGLLEHNAAIYLKSYGQGSLATISMRGTGPGHTGILWNGIPIRPPNVGYVDLSLIPSSYFENIGILYGGSSSVFGSGNVAGALYLGNRLQFGRGHEAQMTLQGASFSSYDISGKYSWSGKKFFTSTALQYHNALNNFPYMDFSGNEVYNENAAVALAGAMQELGFRFGNNTLQASLWYQQSGRNIPPSMTMAESLETQEDQSYRTLLTWKNDRERVSVLGTAGYFHDFLRYEDPSIDLISEITSISYLGQFEGYLSLSPVSRMTAGLKVHQDETDSKYFDERKSEQNLALYATFQHHFKTRNWYLNGAVRQEFNSSFPVPFAFSLAAEGDILPFLGLRFKVSRDFKIPTMVDRYWTPGGNDSLVSEKAWNQEVGLDLRRKTEKCSNQLSFTLFNLIVNDWIQWYPTGGLWRAENLLKVWSRGIEINGKQSINLQKITWNIFEGYTFTRATQESRLSDDDPGYQKQLIYVPAHEFLFRVSIGYQGLEVGTGVKYTDEVYTTKDNLKTLDSYILADLSLSYPLNFRKHSVLASFQVNNIFNIEYQTIEYRPMPGINYSISLKYKFKTIKKL